MIAATQRLASSAESKPNSTGRAPSALRSSLHRRFDDDAELSLGAADEAEPVEAARVEFRSAKLEDVAIERDEVERQAGC